MSFFFLFFLHQIHPHEVNKNNIHMGPLFYEEMMGSHRSRRSTDAEFSDVSVCISSNASEESTRNYNVFATMVMLFLPSPYKGSILTDKASGELQVGLFQFQFSAFDVSFYNSLKDLAWERDNPIPALEEATTQNTPEYNARIALKKSPEYALAGAFSRQIASFNGNIARRQVSSVSNVVQFGFFDSNLYTNEEFGEKVDSVDCHQEKNIDPINTSFLVTMGEFTDENKEKIPQLLANSKIVYEGCYKNGNPSWETKGIFKLDYEKDQGGVSIKSTKTVEQGDGKTMKGSYFYKKHATGIIKTPLICTNISPREAEDLYTIKNFLKNHS